MIGGLLKSTSCLALVAAAGLMVGGVSAKAADLGGDCCADLEERVAELEATTARKGNRKVSLEISGWVSSQVMFWDDGKESNVYVGNNTATATRLRFVGSAKINPTWSAGYLLEFGVYAGATSYMMQQGPAIADDTPTTGGPTGPDSFLQLRHSAWWIDNKHYGRVWVGQTGQATDAIALINLANTTVAGAHAKTSLNDNNMLLRTKAGIFEQGAVRPIAMSNITWGGVRNHGHGDPGDGDRLQVVKYVSPTLMGFIFSAAWGEDDMWDVALRYAGEFSGFKIAAGIGYSQLTDGNADGGNGLPFCANGRLGMNAAFQAPSSDVDCSSMAGSASIMHVATGLFVTAAAGQVVDKNRSAALNQTTAGVLSKADGRDSFWYVQAGIEQNWFGIGKTTLYGEYHVSNNGTGFAAGAVRPVTAADVINPLGTGAVIQSTQVTTWGFGLVQSIDAAAMDLFINYRTRSADVLLSDTVNAGGSKSRGLEDLQIISVGGMIKF